MFVLSFTNLRRFLSYQKVLTKLRWNSDNQATFTQRQNRRFPVARAGVIKMAHISISVFSIPFIL